MDRDFERIVNSHADMLLRICMHYTNNISDAEDAVQAAFLKLVEKNIIFDSPEHEKAWLIRVCINLCKDSMKSSWKKKVFLSMKQNSKNSHMKSLKIVPFCPTYELCPQNRELQFICITMKICP